MAKKSVLFSPTEEEINLEGAKLKSSQSEDSNENETNQNEIKSESLGEKEIKLSDVGKPDLNEKVKINFLNEESVENFTASKSKQSENKVEENENFFKGKTTEEVKTLISEEQKKSEKIDPETFYDIAAFLIFLIDATMSTALRWFAKDTSDSAYSLSNLKQQKLTKQLALILIKYQAKFSIEFMFLISIVILYIPAFLLAKSNRKENTPKVQAVKTTVVKQPVVHNPVVNNPVVNPIVETPNPIIETNEHNPNANEIHETITETEEFKIIKPKGRKKGRVARI